MTVNNYEITKYFIVMPVAGIKTLLCCHLKYRVYFNPNPEFFMMSFDLNSYLYTIMICKSIATFRCTCNFQFRNFRAIFPYLPFQGRAFFCSFIVIYTRIYKKIITIKLSTQRIFKKTKQCKHETLFNIMILFYIFFKMS